MTERFNDDMKKYFEAELGAYTSVTEMEIEKQTFNVKAVIRNILIDRLGKNNIPKAGSGKRQEIEFNICDKMHISHEVKRDIPCKFSKSEGDEMTIYFSSQNFIGKWQIHSGDVWYIYFKENDKTPWFGLLPYVAWEQLFGKSHDAAENIDEQNRKPEINELQYNIDLNNLEIEEVFASDIIIGMTVGDSRVVRSRSAENSGKREKNNKLKGNMGEEIVIEIEKRRLTAIGREDLIPNIAHVAKVRDDLGYDIVSTDVDTSGIERQIFIEVKTTAGGINKKFQISANEVKTSKKLGAAYYIYRIFNLKENSTKISYYKKQGYVGDNFKLDILSYMAIPKGPE